MAAPEAPVRTIEADFPDPVARVVADVPFSWPDLDYDYLVPDRLAEAAKPGTRVRVPFGSGRVTGIILERRATTDAKRLRKVERVLGEPVLTEEVSALIQAIARDHVCSRHDVIRMAIPPRHARGEKAALALPRASFPDASGPARPELIAPGERIIASGHPLTLAIEAAAATLAGGGAALIILPTAADIGQASRRAREALPGEPIARLSAEDSGETRYRHFMSALSGRARLVIGTRQAAYAPLENLATMIIVDEANGAMRDKHSPYLWADEVLRRRLTPQRCLLRLSFPTRVAAPAAPRAVDRSTWPKASVAEQWPGAQVGVLPDAAFSVLRGHDTALISAPRPGYVPALACQRCGKRAQCPQCGLPLAVPSPGVAPSCRACGNRAWRCECGSEQLRAMARGAGRLAQEIGRAFPAKSVEVVRKRGQDTDADIVIATPGAEPQRMFSCAVIIDAGAPLASLSIDAENEAVARWARVARQVGPGGHVLLAGGAPPDLAEALARLDEGYHDRLLGEREVLHQPPFHRWFLIDGKRPDVDRLLGHVGARLADGSAPSASLGDLISGGRQVFTKGLFLLGPTGDEESTRVFLHEAAPAARLSAALRESLGEMGRAQVRVEADPAL